MSVHRLPALRPATALALATGLVLAACGTSSPSDDPAGDAAGDKVVIAEPAGPDAEVGAGKDEAADEPERLSVADLAELHGGSVWRVEADGCGVSGHGSGFAISPNQLITNRHVVDFDPTPTLVSRDGSQTLQGRVVGWSTTPDVAVVELGSDDRFDQWLEWAETDELREGEDIVAIGYPVPAGDFTVTPATILSFQSDDGSRQAIRSDGAIDRGNSGGPALDMTGRVAGVVTEMDVNLEGFQYVPIIYTYDAVGETVEQLRTSDSTVEGDCASAGGRYAAPDWFDGGGFDDTVNGPDAYGEDPTLDDLWDACAAGDYGACDDLYLQSPISSEYEAFGDSCGGRNESAGFCTTIYGAADSAYGSDPDLDLLWDACAAGDLGACDELWFTSPFGSEYETFGATCGGTAEPVFGACAPDDRPSTYGDDPGLDALWDACAAGDLDACDDLYWQTPVGSEYEAFGSTCGGTSTETYGACTDGADVGGSGVFPDVYGDDPGFDALWDACASADLDACDDLYWQTPVGSRYEEYGATCGDRREPVYGSCASG